MATAVKTAKPTFFNTARTTIRRTRRAYLGAHVMAFEFAQKRAARRLDQIKAFGETLVSHGETVEADAKDVFETAKDKVTELLPKADAKKTVEVTPTRVKKVAKPSKKADLSTDITPKAKVAKTPAAKTPAAKTAKPAAPKAAAAPKPAAKPAAQAGTIVTDKYAPYIEVATKYDADVNPLHIKKVVDHLGIALNTRDGQFMACSDPAERETVAKSWLLKKLGVEGSMDALDAKIGEVCHTMKADRMKSRVTFYYLLAKNEGKLGTL